MKFAFFLTINIYHFSEKFKAIDMMIDILSDLSDI